MSDPAAAHAVDPFAELRDQIEELADLIRVRPTFNGAPGRPVRLRLFP